MTMNEALETIDVITLDMVFGGEGEQPAPETNTTDTNANIGVTVPTEGGNIQVGVQGQHRTVRSNYAVCVDTYRRMGGNVTGLRAACGLPNGQP
jgi:hypothetical protein